MVSTTVGHRGLHTYDGTEVRIQADPPGGLFSFRLSG